MNTPNEAGAKGTLGIIAGAGALPALLARAWEGEGGRVFIVALEGIADDSISAFPHSRHPIGKFGASVAALKAAGCEAVTMAGKVKRPDWGALIPDLKGAALMPRLVAAATRGDDAILRALIDAFESEGLPVRAPETILKSLAAPEGDLAQKRATPTDDADIERAIAVLRALSPLDVGQGCVVAEGVVLAVEAAQGTDQMLADLTALPAHLKGTAGTRKGVLVKMAKTGQERRVDLPAVGAATVERAAAAGLAGIAVEAEGALIIDRLAAIARADALGLFLKGVRAH